MMRMPVIGAALALPLLLPCAAAAQTASAAEAKAMLEKAIAELKSNETAALAKFAKGEGGFKDRDLYVFCFDTKDGKFTAHINPALMGTDVRALKDRAGKALGEELYNSAKEGQVTTVSYMFPKPGATDASPKESYLTKVGGQACAVGYYK